MALKIGSPLRLLAVCLMLTAVPAHGQLPQAVSQALNSAGIGAAHVSLVAQPLDGAKPALTHNPAAAFNPASVMKLLTTYAALELLGPAYTWKTEFYSTVPPADGVLEGDLYLRGSGDPRLTLESFWMLLRQLRARGVREIRGDLVLDRSQFQIPPQDPGQFDREPLRAYNVAPDALLLNYKAVRVDFLPEATAGAVRVSAEPHPPQLELVSLLRLANGPCNDWREHVRADLTRHGARAKLIFTGSYPAACEQKSWNLGVLDHHEYVEGVFRQLWTEIGGVLQGAVREAAVPADAKPLASAESPALSEIVRDINKWSNNVMARQLYLTLGAERGQRPARAEDADRVLRAWLAAKGLSFPELVLENGSGLSRRERLSAESLARLLAAAWKSPVMPEFMASLPLTGVDGTMKRRLTSNGAAGSAHVKTGSLEGVRSIAGYVLDRSGRRWAFAFLVNHPNAAAAQPAQDALIAWIRDH